VASLQVRHQRGCELGRPWTSASPDALEGCSCTPTYNVVSRVDDKLIREPTGHDRAEAEKRLARVEFHFAENDYVPPRHERFCRFADEWLASLRRRSTTHTNYAVTLGYAKRAFGKKHLSKLGVADVRKMLELVEREHRERQKPKKGEKPREVSPTTLAKHLRQLSTCLESAVAEGLLAVNPVKRMPKSAKPKPRKKRPAYFTDAELMRLWPELVPAPDTPPRPPVYLTLCKLAATTGMRHGELAGLRWSDVQLLEGELHLRQQFTAGELVDRTKSGEPRVVDLVPAARALLEEWWNETGDDGLVFENALGGPLDASNTRKALYAAMGRAGIPRVGERGGTRDFHSFRHTFARIALEHGAQLEWVQAQLGHSSITLTRDVYGHWSRKAEKVAAERLEGAFAV
jgi:integrase